MLRKHKWGLVLSSAAILLPVLVGLLLWDRLPAQMTTHWGADGVADGWGGKAFAVFVLPLLLLALHWVCIFFTAKDPKNQNQNKKIFGMVLWITPVISIFVCGIIYNGALGRSIDAAPSGLVPLGLLFLVLGNYLPKCGQNRTIGIKLKWTLASEENWNATHRLGGRLWMIGGLLILACIFLPAAVIPWVLVVVLPVMALIPVVYSYVYYQKQIRAGNMPKRTDFARTPTEKKIVRVTMIFVAALFVVLAVIMFTGDIQVQYGETSFTVEASYWGDMTVSYDAIDSIEYRETSDPGARTSGFGSPRLSLGMFQNSEFGTYTRYCYTQCDACVILSSGAKTLVLNGKDAAATRAIYETLLGK